MDKGSIAWATTKAHLFKFPAVLSKDIPKVRKRLSREGLHDPSGQHVKLSNVTACLHGQRPLIKIEDPFPRNLDDLQSTHGTTH